MTLMAKAKDHNIHAEEHNPGSAQDRRTSKGEAYLIFVTDTTDMSV